MDNNTGRQRQSRDIVVIGGSAGALAPLRTIVESLRCDAGAPAVFVVLHVAAGHESVLPTLLDRWSPFTAALAEDDLLIRPGCILVAPPDHHLLLGQNRVKLRRGPKENSARPAIDPLFRSAAAHHDARVIAVLLSGYLMDGTAGLRAVQRCGGVTIVQDPQDARVEEMPAYALSHVEADFVAEGSRIGALINQLAGQPTERRTEIPDDVRLEARMAAGEGLTIANENRLGATTAFACPDCGGNLWEIADGSITRFRCHAGHAYTGPAVAAAQKNELDRALWSALRALRERASLLRRLAEDADRSGRSVSGAGFARTALEVEKEAEVLQRFISEPVQPSIEEPLERLSA